MAVNLCMKNDFKKYFLENPNPDMVCIELSRYGYALSP